MKKIKIILLLSMMLPLLNITAQKVPAFAQGAGTANREAEFGCVPNSLYSQLPAPLATGWFADDGYGFTRAADDYTVTGPFSTMRFWGSNYDGCPIGATQDFIIKFYQRNAGDPTIPGAEAYSFSLTAVPQPISLFYNPDYQIDVTFPSSVTLLDGWVSVTRVNPNDQCVFIWYGSIGGNAASYYLPNNAWEIQGAALAFCLGGGELPETPLSNWALIIGIILIGTFVIIRFRRLV
jgi:hypothetical protein